MFTQLIDGCWTKRFLTITDLDFCARAMTADRNIVSRLNQEIFDVLCARKTWCRSPLFKTSRNGSFLSHFSTNSDGKMFTSFHNVASSMDKLLSCFDSGNVDCSHRHGHLKWTFSAPIGPLLQTSMRLLLDLILSSRALMGLQIERVLYFLVLCRTKWNFFVVL